jgi:type I restriction enzyme R subunit
LGNIDEDMREMLRNNPLDVVRSAYDQTAFQKMIRMLQHVAEMCDITLTDPEIRNKVTSYLFGRALRDAQGAV